MVGAAERVLEMTVEYAKTRVQFGRPIGSFQAVAHRCVDMRSDLDALRYLVYQAAWSLAAARHSDLEVSAAKAYGNEALRRIFMHAHQVHGAIGFSTEHDLQLFTRRAKAAELHVGLGESAPRARRAGDGAVRRELPQHSNTGPLPLTSARDGARSPPPDACDDHRIQRPVAEHTFSATLAARRRRIR